MGKTTLGNTQNELQACFNKLSIQEKILCNAEKFAKFEEETTETEKRMNKSLISKSEDMQKQKLEYEEIICVTTKEKEAEILRLEEEATYERKVKKTELLRLEEEATYQRNKLINKGKNMLKTSKEVAEKETLDLNFAHEKKVDSLLENEKRVKVRIRLYDQQLNLQAGEITQLS